MGPKCPGQFGISAEVSHELFGTGTKVSGHFRLSAKVSMRQFGTEVAMSHFRHCYRNVLGSKCLGTEVSGIRQFGDITYLVHNLLESNWP